MYFSGESTAMFNSKIADICCSAHLRRVVANIQVHVISQSRSLPFPMRGQHMYIQVVRFNVAERVIGIDIQFLIYLSRSNSSCMSVHEFKYFSTWFLKLFALALGKLVFSISVSCFTSHCSVNQYHTTDRKLLTPDSSYSFTYC